MEDRLLNLENKLKNFVFLEDCDTVINKNTTVLELDCINNVDLKLRAILQVFTDKEHDNANPLILSEEVQQIFISLGMEDKLYTSNATTYLIGKTFNGIVYTQFVYEMVARLLTYVLSNPTTHMFNGSSIDAVAELSKLTQFAIRNNNGITDISPLKLLRRLTKVELVNCYNINPSETLAELYNLTEVTLVGDRHITDLTFLHNMKKLKSLFIMNCTTLVDTMIALPLLSKIVYVNCTNIGNLHELKNLPTLNTLVLDNCEVKDYTFVENLTTVENLTISTEDVVKLPPSVKMYNGKKVEEVS
jgi:hypothetical protein